MDLFVEPGLPPVKNVRPLLLARTAPWGVRGFFKRHVLAVEQTPDRAWRHTQAISLEDMVNQLDQRDVTVLRQGYDLIGMRFKVMGSTITAPSTRASAASDQPI